jgi:hypothetical protein
VWDKAGGVVGIPVQVQRCCSSSSSIVSEILVRHVS